MCFLIFGVGSTDTFVWGRSSDFPVFRVRWVAYGWAGSRDIWGIRCMRLSVLGTGWIGVRISGFLGFSVREVRARDECGGGFGL